ncbi:putative protein OS=Streptomyces microflavus OX=1919 GN=Smic_64430 PE=4 SV=1 [Streptomyces microflavus]
MAAGRHPAATVVLPVLTHSGGVHGPARIQQFERFPLVARFRPACLPLSKRVRALVDLADTAVTETDQGVASSVYNQAALIASDLGLPDLAREMCHEHAAAYLHACPLSAMSAIRCLGSLSSISPASRSVADTPTWAVSGCLTCTRLSRRAGLPGSKVSQFRLTSPRRTRTAAKSLRGYGACSWPTARAPSPPRDAGPKPWQHIEAHRGVGKRMLDGRQVAVLASLAEGDTAHASALLADTMPGETWEQTVTACLTVLSRRAAGSAVRAQLSGLATASLDRQAEPGMTVFDA